MHLFIHTFIEQMSIGANYGLGTVAGSIIMTKLNVVGAPQSLEPSGRAKQVKRQSQQSQLMCARGSTRYY